MAITINTNLASLTVQRNLSRATNTMDVAMERMSTGFRINRAADDAAGMAVATKMESQISGAKVAKENTQMGMSLLNTAEGMYDILISNLQRIRDLTEQAANGTYGSDSITGIIGEVQARLDEITRISNIADFNGIKLLDGTTKDINLQVGMNNTQNDIITLDRGLFSKADSTTLLGSKNGNKITYTYRDNNGTTRTGQINLDVKNIAEVYKPQGEAPRDCVSRGFLTNIDSALSDAIHRKTLLGCIGQRVNDARSSLDVQEESLTESHSLIKDADIATESSNYIQSQILQKIATSLLATANQAPSIALELI